MEKLRKLYTAAMLLTVSGLLVYGAGKVFFTLAFRAGRAILVSALLSLPAVALLGVGFVLLVCGVGCFIALTAEQWKQPDPADAED